LAGCEYGDRAAWCPDYVTGADKCQRQDIAEQCCKSCDKYKRMSSHFGKYWHDEIAYFSVR